MLSIRLKPKGKKRQRSYRIVVDKTRSKLNGKVIEDLGWLNPHTDEHKINDERAKYWLSVGAQPSDTVHNLFVTAEIIDAKKKSVHSTKKKKEGEETSEEKAPEESQPEEVKEEQENSNEEVKEEGASEESEEEEKEETSEASEEDNNEETKDNKTEEEGSNDKEEESEEK